MKRIELFEFEDFHWLPNAIRTGATNLIAVLHKMMGTADVITGILVDIQKQNDFTQITDLGSGSGGPMPDVIQQINNKNDSQSIQLILTDLHPNPKLVEDIHNRNPENVRYYPKSVDATNIGEAPGGLKTMIASFHHMPPTVAKKILQSAQDNQEPILIYEIAKNNIPILLWWLLLPLSLLILMLMSIVMTLFVRPLSITQLIFTYIIPIIPIVYAWDGQASLMRTYTFEDIKNHLLPKEKGNYQWEVKEAKKSNGKNLGHYIMGYPKE